MKPSPALLLALAMLTGCATSSDVIRGTNELTATDIAENDLECREIKPIGSNIAETRCGSEAAWARYDRRQRDQRDTVFEDISRNTPSSYFERQSPGF